MIISSNTRTRYHLCQRWCGQASAGDREEENRRFLVHVDSHLYFVMTVEPGVWGCGGRLGRQMECLLSFHCHRLHVRVCLKLCQGVSLCLSLSLVTENWKHKEPQISRLAVIRDRWEWSRVTCGFHLPSHRPQLTTRHYTLFYVHLHFWHLADALIQSDYNWV